MQPVAPDGDRMRAWARLQNSASFRSTSRILPLKPSSKTFHKAMSHVGLPGPMSRHSTPCPAHRFRVSPDVGSVPLFRKEIRGIVFRSLPIRHDHPGLPRRSISAASSRATHRPEMDVSGIAARHPRVMSCYTLRYADQKGGFSSCRASRLSITTIFLSIRQAMNLALLLSMPPHAKRVDAIAIGQNPLGRGYSSRSELVPAATIRFLGQGVQPRSCAAHHYRSGSGCQQACAGQRQLPEICAVPSDADHGHRRSARRCLARSQQQAPARCESSEECSACACEFSVPVDKVSWQNLVTPLSCIGCMTKPKVQTGSEIVIAWS